VLHSPRFLVVDDDASLRMVVAEVLERMGCEVHLAATGREALSVARRIPVDASFLDVEMPGIDGFETARELRRLRREIAVIFLTGVGTESARRRGEELRCFAWLDKPVGRGDLEDVARRLDRWTNPYRGMEPRFMA